MRGFDLETLIGRILPCAAEKRMPVIGIDGLGGAGKSTLSEAIKERLESDGYHVVLLHADDFIFQRSIRYNDAYSQWKCYYELQWRYNYLKSVIDDIKSTEDSVVSIDLYDKVTDCYDPFDFPVTDNTIIILEGVFLQRKELEGMFDLMIYIDLSEEERLSRVLKRDEYIGSEDDIRRKYEKRYFPAERFYVEKHAPAEKADVVIQL